MHKPVELLKGNVHNWSSENMRLPLSFDRLQYAVKIRIGTPKYSITSGDGHWQCSYLDAMRALRESLSPNSPNSYRQIPCNHPICLSDPNLFRCIDQKCVYTQRYASVVSTRGVASEEIFEFLHNYRASIVFGCPNLNLNFPSGDTGRVAGVLGFGFGAKSTVQQLGRVIDYPFSYCHAPFNQASRASGYLRFGNDIHTRGRRFKSTPIVSPPGYSNCFLNLLDISINGHSVWDFLQAPFSIRRNGTGGCIIDSAAPVASIHQNAYQQVIRSFENYFTSFRLQRYPFTYGGMNLCYRYDRNFHAHDASMTYHFQGADLTVEPQNEYFFFGPKSYFPRTNNIVDCLKCHGRTASTKHSIHK